MNRQGGLRGRMPGTSRGACTTALTSGALPTVNLLSRAQLHRAHCAHRAHRVYHAHHAHHAHHAQRDRRRGRPCSVQSNAGGPGVDELGPAQLDALGAAVPPAVAALRAWKGVYHKCVVPRSLETDEAKYLVRTMKYLRMNKGALTDDQVELLTSAGMVWEVPSTVESKWWSNFHAAKAFLDTETDQDRIRDFLNHEMEDPHPFRDGTPDAVEASRWLGRQRVLYRRQKLTLMQVDLLKRVLPGVRLVRQRGKARRNKHQAIRKADEAFLESASS